MPRFARRAAILAAVLLGSLPVLPAAAASGARPAAAAPPTIWGVDSASFVYDVLAGARHYYGEPRVFGRYITTNAGTGLGCNGHGLSDPEVSDLFAAGISVLLLDATAVCDYGVGPYSGPEGTTVAAAVVRAAAALGVPRGVALYEDIEWDGQPTPAFLVSYFDYVRSHGYLPGFYGQTGNPADQYFEQAFCAALGTDTSLGSALYWASAPEPGTGRSGPSNMPPFTPDTIGCAGAPTAVVWQYGRAGVPKNVNVDTDELTSTVGLWNPPPAGQFVSSGGQLYRIAGGAPLPVTSWAAVGGEPPGTVVASWSTQDFAYLPRYPADGTVLVEAHTQLRFVVTSGVAVWSPSATGPAVTVDPAAVDRAGEGGVWDHLARPNGYWLVSADGAVGQAGTAGSYGSLSTTAADPVVDAAATPDGGGYWLVTREGTVAPFGDARSFGDLPAEQVTADDIVAVAPTADGGGYWLIGADGGIFCFGDARYHGSIPGLGLRVSDVVGMVASPSALGYTVVAADGGVFAFGATHFFGSLPGLGVRVHSIRALLPAPAGTGYVLVGNDGGVFVFGHGAPYHGSLPGEGYELTDVIGIALTGDGNGYWMAAANGFVHGFGDAPVLVVSTTPALPVVAIAGA